MTKVPEMLSKLKQLNKSEMIYFVAHAIESIYDAPAFKNIDERNLQVEVSDKVGSAYYDIIAPEVWSLPQDESEENPGRVIVKIDDNITSINDMEKLLKKWFGDYGANGANFTGIVVVNTDLEKGSSIPDGCIDRYQQVGERQVQIQICSLENFLKVVRPEQFKTIMAKVAEGEKPFILRKQSKIIEAEREELKERIIDKLVESYRMDDLVLFLGAGVSISAGLPSWQQLNRSLLEEVIKEEAQGQSIELSNINVEEISNILFSQANSSQIVMARFFRSYFKDRFIDFVHKMIYCGYTEEGTPGSKFDDTLLESVVDLCRPPRGSRGIKAIVNYNFDSLLEEKLDSRKIEYIPVTSPEEMVDNRKLSLYHVHGYLPRESIDNQYSNNIVFSEEAYHRLLKDPYHWVNIKQLEFFGENTCLFIGMSMSDPSLRRLLEVSYLANSSNSGNPKHYAIIKKYNFDSVDSSEDLVELLYGLEQVSAESYRELNIEVLWIDDFGDIPYILRTIRD